MNTLTTSSTAGRSSGGGLKKYLAPLALGMAVALGGCATTFKADVSRFQSPSMLPAPEGQSFYVVAEDPALAGGLEFSMYADLVEDEMGKLGYAQAASPEQATLLVQFDYGVDEGREKVRSSNIGYYGDPFYRSWYSYRPIIYRTRSGPRVTYVPTRNWGYGWYDPFFDRGGVESYTVYNSGIELKIDNTANGERLFEGRAEALSTSNHLQYLVPNLVEAMFTDFPGNSGETVRISVAPEKDK